MTRYSSTMRDALAKIRGGNLHEAPEDNMPASPDEGSMAVQQLEFMMHAVERMKMHIAQGGEFPEWMQNKLSGAHEKLKGLYANIEHGDMNEAVLANRDYKVKDGKVHISMANFKKVSKDYKNDTRGKERMVVLDPKTQATVSMPVVFEEVDLEEGAFNKLNLAAKDLAKYAAKDKKGMDYNDFMKAAAMMKTGKVKELAKFVDNLDTEPRDHIIMTVKDALGKDAAEKMFQVSIREAKEILSRFRDDKLKQNTINLAKQSGLKVKDMGDKIEISGNARRVMDITLAVQKQDVKIEELEEGKSSTGYELYHKDFSSAMKHAYDFAKKKFGIEVDPKEIDDKVASGPRKPSKGKTNSYRLMGNDGKKAIQVQVYGMDNGKYELNMYKEGVEPIQWPSQPLEEKLKVSDGLGAWIDDFKKSDAPQFAGKSDEEKKNMAIAAFTDAGGKLESVNEMREPYAVVDTADGNKVVGTASDEKGAKSIITSAELPPMKIKDKKTLKIVKVKKKQMIGQPIKEEEEPNKPDTAKAVDQGREDKKKTRIAQLQLQIAKAQDTINKLNAQEKPNG